MKDNKLIAEFMGDISSMNAKVSFSKNCGVNDLQYHTSWDWLMPVINKCLTLKYKQCMQTGDNTDEWDALYDALSTVNITNTHNRVVEFIKQYNK